MKSFFNFLSEARVSKAAEKAKKLGLTSDGSGGWVDREGNVKFRTVGGELVFNQKKVLVQRENLVVKKVDLPNNKHKVESLRVMKRVQKPEDEKSDSKEKVVKP